MSDMQQQPAFAGTTHIGVVLDKSGSMGGVRKETIGGFNAWLATMQKEPGDIRLSLTLFDTMFSTPVKEAPIAKVNPLDESRYQPSGATALLDAVADSIKALENGEAANGSDRYLLCIVTDGEENSSTRTRKEELAELIRQKEATGRWTFTYLSAGMDAFADASAIGIQMGNTVAYRGDAVGTKAAFGAVASHSVQYARSANLCSASFYGDASHVDDLVSDVDPLDQILGTKPQPRVTGGTSWTSEAQVTGCSPGWLRD